MDYPRAIEDGFPTGFLSRLAKRESWRKEIYRPPYYQHKWWARRLGSVFRGILLSSALPADSDIQEEFYKRQNFEDYRVLDPFMGSGVTVGEARKLGFQAGGRDIDPVAALVSENALSDVDPMSLKLAFKEVKKEVGNEIRELYRHDEDPHRGDILYYFWRRTAPCPGCNFSVPLFSKYRFAQHAYPSKHPESRSICPNCSSVHQVLYTDDEATCPDCKVTYDPEDGPKNRTTVDCPECENNFKLIDVARSRGEPLPAQMFAKLVSPDSGGKEYLEADETDVERYKETSDKLEDLQDFLPEGKIQPGHNTDQILNYGFREWSDMFNDRQLYCLGLIAQAIRNQDDPTLRTPLAVLLSGILEYNCMFATYKGEGTGAVRPLFSHHILKPEMVPLEANVWGTPDSSGGFEPMFERRIQRALEYKEDPFELELEQDGDSWESSKVRGINQPLFDDRCQEYQDWDTGNVWLTHGDSADIDAPEDSLDLVITDPPFFDNVNYSELSGFFYPWLKNILPDRFEDNGASTRDGGRVQDQEVADFEDKLHGVFKESHRLLGSEGLLATTYHHGRDEGWLAFYRALRRGGFVVTDCHPVKAEMSVSVSIQQATEPINYDLVVAARPENTAEIEQGENGDGVASPKQDIRMAVQDESEKLISYGLEVSRGDRYVIAMGEAFRKASYHRNLDQEEEFLQRVMDEIPEIITS